MDNKITLSVLAQMLSERTGSSRKDCEELLRSFFRTISATLAAGEPVKVRGFGTFKISPVDARMSVDVSSGQDYEIPAHNRIVFIPAKELAGMVNAPFSMFETIELADSLTDADLEETETAEEGERGEGGERGESEGEREEREEEGLGGEAKAEIGAEAVPPQSEAENAEAAQVEIQESVHEPESVSEEDSSTDEESVSEEDNSTEEESIPEEDDSTEETPDPEDACEPEPESYVIASDDEEETDEHDCTHSDSEEKQNPEQQSREVEGSSSEPKERAGGRFGHGFIWGMVAALLLILLAGGMLYLLNDSFHSSVSGLTSKEPVAVATEKNDESRNSSAIPGEGDVAMAADMAEAETGMDDVVEDQPEEKDAPADSAVPTRPSDQPVYDTVTASAGLGVLARKHYGNYHFWPYIYKENEKIIGHPDRIRPGTRLVIPPLSKFGVDPRKAEDLAKAKRLDAEIYARYKTGSKKR